MQGNVYNKKNPIIVGVDVVEGTLKVCHTCV
jgi:translation initiation factor IF-2